MITEYKLVGLSKPSSATLEFFNNPTETFNAKFNHDKGLWDYCKNNWDTVNLKAIVEHDDIDCYGMPVNPVVIKVMPIELIDQKVHYGRAI